MRLKAALVIMLFGTVSCLQLLDECMPKNFIDTHVKGSEMKLRVWVPEIGDASLLTLISESDWTSMARKIEIWKNVITVQTQDGHTVSPEHELPIQKSLPHGWVNFMVTSNENFTVTVPDVNLTLIDVQDVVQGNYIVIIGSSVTVNCMLPTNQWEVSTHQNAIIPLSPNGSHDFSLFSRTPYAPMLTISNLPWLFDDFKSEPQLLFPFSSYNFTVDCAIDEKLGSCYIPVSEKRLFIYCIYLLNFA
ncbi:uncharacterized protein LOC134769693 [Penaeus indicus]|uniref:uncharacterized protein LOC134769693 n=1 Tax=Penaeus indicus TaxID=29960 RepID=UPI00300D1B50